MTGIDKALLRQLLSISGAWEISDYQLEVRKQRCDVWIGPLVERNWFGRPKTTPTRGQQHTWQHLSFGNLRFVVHVSAPAGLELGRMAWTGTVGMPFTHALAHQVFVMFNEGMTVPAICKLMHLSLNDVWKYRFAIDNGLVQTQTAGAAPATPAAPAKTVAPAAPVAAAAPMAALPAATNGTPTVDLETDAEGAVPDVTDPVWLRVASGDLKLDIKVLSLKLMLTKVRSQLEVISDDEVRMLKLRDLHRYFVKNERVLGHELSQLKAE